VVKAASTMLWVRAAFVSTRPGSWFALHLGSLLDSGVEEPDHLSDALRS
jgi:hypothetical protein